MVDAIKTGMPASYTVYKSGTTYYAKNGLTEKVDYSGSDFSVVINAAISALPTADHQGTIFLRNDGSIYYAPTTITLYKKTHIVGEGGYARIYKSGSTANLITIDPTVSTVYDYSLRNLFLRMQDINGNAIYSTKSANNSGWGLADFSNVMIDGVKNSYSGMDLTDWFYSKMSNIWIGTAGYGMTFRNSGTAIDYGNSTFSKITIKTGTGDVMQTGLNIIGGGAGYRALNLTTFIDYECLCGGSAGTSGLVIDSESHITFIGGSIEGFKAYGVLIDDSSGISFKNMHIGSGAAGAGTYAVRLTGNTFRVSLDNGHIYTASAGTAYSDESTSSTYRNHVVSGCYLGVGLKTMGRTKMRDSYSYISAALKYSENGGTTTVATGGTIAHNLYATPTKVRLIANGIIPTEFAYTADATNITVYHTSAGSPSVTWEAEV